MTPKPYYLNEKDFLHAKDDSPEHSLLIENEGNAAYLVGWYWLGDDGLVGPFDSQQEAEDDAQDTLGEES